MFTAEIWGSVSDWVMIVVTFITGILLFFALIKQIESNKIQRVKNESDIILLLLNQLEVEYNNFSITFTQRTGNQLSVEIRKYGYDGFSYYYKAMSSGPKPGLLEGFKNDTATDNVLSLIRSFMLIRERVKLSDLTEDIQNLIYKKLDILYRTKFGFPIDCILMGIGGENDPLVDEIKAFKTANTQIKL